MTCNTLRVAQEIKLSSVEPHYMQELKPADSDFRMENGKLVLGWHGVYGKM